MDPTDRCGSVPIECWDYWNLLHVFTVMCQIGQTGSRGSLAASYLLRGAFSGSKAASRLLNESFMLWHVDKSRGWPGPTRPMGLSLSKARSWLRRAMRRAPASLVRANKSIRKLDTASMLLRDGSKRGFPLTRHDDSPRDCSNFRCSALIRCSGFFNWRESS